ncbi:glutathione-dependent disulfide-bond oxidoreductase [Streptococcus oricebi]|uniref:Glutathione-dependent disulfide-bond oxidoreductase n=1 Tax=Streptococcus oricebi TaxID=1547447 RepID=A0ABS5B218_9STRE|nr:glutathione-dependent disulfide-bond oxidoreductase [Streptococcus oricebi]MBP2622877.1 glutathione-dependent disulfide-bond oxidoreductase [Streptococcus oricebi]
MSEYKKPLIWEWEEPHDGRAGNKPTAGARFELALPRGKAPFQIYSLGTPNGIKVSIMLEELRDLGVTGIDYDQYKIDIVKGQQFASGFVALNPNSKIPVLLDQSGSEDISVFESANILLYLAEKFGHLLPQDLKGRTEVLNWLFWQTGAAPFLGGGFGHFFHYAPSEQKYPIDRYSMEVKRQLDLLDQVLASRPYIAGSDYSIADIAIWSWYGRLSQDKIYPGAAKFLQTDSYPHFKAWVEKIAQRPGVKRGLAAPYQDLGES